MPHITTKDPNTATKTQHSQTNKLKKQKNKKPETNQVNNSQSATKVTKHQFSVVKSWRHNGGNCINLKECNYLVRKTRHMQLH